MSIKKNFFIVMLSLSLLSFLSCSEEDMSKVEKSLGCTDFSVAVKDYSDALDAYVQNPGPETCEDYKSALLEFAKEYKNCSFWTESYQEAFDNIDDIDCEESEM